MRFSEWKYHPRHLLSRVLNRSDELQSQHEKQQQFLDIIENLQSMANAIPDAALVIDGHDLVTWFNDPAKQLLNLVNPADRDQVLTSLIQAPGFADWLAIQDKVSSKFYMPCPVDDDISLEVNVAGFGNRQRLLILRDITEIENLDQIRRDFIANISHELRTPLTVLLGYLELVQDQPENLDTQTIKSMFKQAKQMHALLEDLLELSKIQDKETRRSTSRIDMRIMLDQLKEQAKAYSKDHHEMLFEIQPELNLRGNEADLRSAFQNLLINAVNYTPPGGTIRLSWKSTDEGLVLTVKDTGIGIPKKDLPRITERFYRVGSDRARQTGGTGLGLAIVKHILNSHQARLEISSQLGKGSEFRCIFPFDRQV